MYYRGANAALLLYDITNSDTFDDVRGWLEGVWCHNSTYLRQLTILSPTELKKNCSPDLIIYIVGSKADLHRQRQVTSDRVRLSLARWFPPPHPPSPPTPPAPQLSTTLSYIRPRFTSFTTSRSIPANSLAPKAQDDNTLSRPSELRRSTTAFPRASAIANGHAGVDEPLRRANSSNAAGSPRRQKFLDSDRAPPIFPGSRFGSHFGLRAGVPANAVGGDGSSNSVPEEDEDGDDNMEWGLEKGMSLFEVSAKDDYGKP